MISGFKDIFFSFLQAETTLLYIMTSILPKFFPFCLPLLLFSFTSSDFATSNPCA